MSPTRTLRAAGRRLGAIVLMAALAASVTGCAAISNPLVDSIPVRLLPPELLGPSKAGLQTIPLNVLSQPSQPVYRLAAGDVLGVYIDGILGDKNIPIPLHIPPLSESRDTHRQQPASGYPVPVLEDGTVQLPSLPKLKVEGMSLATAREAIRDAYLKKELIRPDNDRISVTLLYPRQIQVVVMRQEASSYLLGSEGVVATGKRNSGAVIDLPAYHNDVLHALAKTGGLPDFDAYNEVIIYRDGVSPDVLQGCRGETIRIPMRVPVGAPLPFRLEDALLRDGDTIFLEARDEQVFFSAGLLPPGKHVLPRDLDLDVIEAIAQVRGPLYNGAFGGSALSGNFLKEGVGNPSPSLLVVVRRVPGHGQVQILVDLRKAFRDPTERIRVQPGDVLLLQEKPAEAFARYMTQTALNYDFFFRIFRSSSGLGFVNIAGPDRLSGRLNTVTTPLP